jgi:hypothetical protein
LSRQVVKIVRRAASLRASGGLSRYLSSSFWKVRMATLSGRAVSTSRSSTEDDV